MKPCGDVQLNQVRDLSLLIITTSISAQLGLTNYKTPLAMTWNNNILQRLILSEVFPLLIYPSQAPNDKVIKTIHILAPFWRFVENFLKLITIFRPTVTNS